MFQVKHRAAGTLYTVYAVMGGLALVWVPGEDAHWEWRDLNEFEPVEQGHGGMSASVRIENQY